jgi:hypothetical protein
VSNDLSVYEEQIPSLRDHPYEQSSEPDPAYNCIAWAAGCNHRPWWPPAELSQQTYWPPGVPALETLDAFCEAFEAIGYTRGSTERPPAEVERVAIYWREKMGGPCHAARQLIDGKWASKLGVGIDIEHEHLGALEGDEVFAYGTVKAMLWRDRKEANV